MKNKLSMILKNKLIVILLLLCFILSGCNNKEKQSASPETPEPSAITPAIITLPVTQDYLDFGSHTDPKEASYQTILADPVVLKNGGTVLALKEPVADWSGRTFDRFIKSDIWGYDVRSMDISGADLNQIGNYNELSFNSDTIWPKQLLKGFNPEYILEFNQNPGLGIRALQKQGINGSGIGIATIDQPLQPDHEQYKDNLMLYEKIHCIEEGAQMHGPAVASIAVGNTIGVAPGAKLYYIASTFGHFTDSSYEFDASIMAACIMRILEINDYLPDSGKIRAISISGGYTKADKGYQELTDAIGKANDENVFVITTSTSEYYGFDLGGMGRGYLGDPDDFNSYGPEECAADMFYSRPDMFGDVIRVPMGSRTYASCTGTDKYEIVNEGGISWTVPWFAGFYALCCQVKPDITPQEFIEAVKATAITTNLEHDRILYKFGKIVNPAGVIDKLRED